jgi:hypothetical protein
LVTHTSHTQLGMPSSTHTTCMARQHKATNSSL